MNVMADGLPIGELIRAARGRRRWTQQELADRLEVNRKTVDNWENSRTTPTRATVAALEDVLATNLTDDTDADPNEAALRSLDGLDTDELAKLVEAYRAIRNGAQRKRTA